MDDIGRRGEDRAREESMVPYCGPDEIEASLAWTMTDRGGLSGRLTLRNVGNRACRVGGKPEITPLAVNGAPLPTQHIITLEKRVPSWTIIGPGESAAAGVWWSGWCGAPASGEVRVAWEQGEATVTADGPHQPQCLGSEAPTNTSSSWFNRIPEA
ncbi:MAG: DUF4232 domain-containing protein [Candidatus Dormibacteraeota bacterium]|nr:DUF4232 domain-containing protein [Candidatus Dormibacteraeota bacterium]